MTLVRALDVTPVSLPLTEPYRIATAVQRRGEYVVFGLLTDDGLERVGEAAPFMGESEETQAGIVAVARAYLAPALVGVDPFDLEALHARMDAVLPGHLFAKSGADLACHDLVGRRLGVPVYRLLGGRVRDRVSLAGGPIGLVESPAGAAERAARLVAAGFRTVKLKIGHPEALDVPVMADEPVSTPADVLRIAERRAADLVKVKVMRSGGLHRARKVLAVAEAAGLPVVVGSGHESSIGVAAELHLATASRAVPYAGEMVGQLRLAEEVVAEPLAAAGGTAAAPEGPGLGVALVPAKVARLAC